MQGVQVTIDNTNRLYCRWFKLPPTIQTVCIVIDNTNRLYCSWLAIQTVCIVVGLQYKRFVLSAPQYKPFVLSSMQYKLFVLQLRATIQTVCIAGGSSYHTCVVDMHFSQFITDIISFDFNMACEKVASDLGLGCGFRRVLRFPLPVTTG